MSALLFDTSAILAHYLEEEGWEQVENFFLKPQQAILICAVSLVELNSRLLELGENPSDRRKILNEYRGFCADVVAVDESIARLAIQLRESTPSRLPLTDSLIAACAKQRDATLIHRDPHFRVISSSDLKQIELPPKTKVS